MNDNRQQPYGTSGPQNDWWSRRPRRSRSDSKIAGVAGGLGRYLGVDPILFRVGFVALTILGGVGVLAYCLLWLLLPADGDDVSAGESLIGRGRSSVSPILAVGLALLVVISITSSLSWGLPFWPVAIIALIVFHVARKQRRGPFRPGSDWQQRMHSTGEALRSNEWPAPGQDDRDFRTGPGYRSPGQQAGNWWGGSWGCNTHGSTKAPTASSAASTASGAAAGRADDATSPFETPAFWDTPGSSGGQGGSGTAGTGPTGFGASTTFSTAGGSAPTTGFSTTESGTTSFDAPAGGSGSTGPSTGVNPDTLLAPDLQRTPPSWDPLGAAPFAWDLPDIEVAPKQTQTLERRRAPSPVIGRAAVGTALLVTAVQVFGIMVGWWSMAWAAISGTALAIVAVGVLLQALRGRTMTLVFPGVMLSVATVALAMTGMAGTASVGDRTWAPTTPAAVESHYELSAGEARLDLSDLTIPGGQTVNTSLHVNAGNATVQLPAGVNLDVTCTSNAGDIFCVGLTQDGLNNQQQYTSTASSDAGTLHLDVHVGTGQVRVTR